MRAAPLLCLFALVSLSACRPQPPPGSEARGQAALVWMAQTYSGGRQCQPREPYSPPNAAAELAREDIEVIGIEVEQLSVCQACSCPSYAARHFVQIRAADVEKAAALGFELVDGPPAQ